MRYLISLAFFLIVSCSATRFPDSVGIMPIGDFSSCRTMLDYELAFNGTMVSFTWYIPEYEKNENIIVKLWKYNRAD